MNWNEKVASLRRFVQGIDLLQCQEAHLGFLPRRKGDIFEDISLKHLPANGLLERQAEQAMDVQDRLPRAAGTDAVCIVFLHMACLQEFHLHGPEMSNEVGPYYGSVSPQGPWTYGDRCTVSEPKVEIFCDGHFGWLDVLAAEDVVLDFRKTAFGPPSATIYRLSLLFSLAVGTPWDVVFDSPPVGSNSLDRSSSHFLLHLVVFMSRVRSADNLISIGLVPSPCVFVLVITA